MGAPDANKLLHDALHELELADDGPRLEADGHIIHAMRLLIEYVAELPTLGRTAEVPGGSEGAPTS